MCLGEPDVTRMESRSHLQRFMRNTTRREMTLKEQTSAIHLEDVGTKAGSNPRSKSNSAVVCVTETRGSEHTVNPAVRRKLKGPDRSGDQPRFWAMNLNGHWPRRTRRANQAPRGLSRRPLLREAFAPTPRNPRSPAISSQGGRQKFLCVQVMWFCPEQVAPYLVRYRLRYYHRLRPCP